MFRATLEPAQANLAVAFAKYLTDRKSQRLLLEQANLIQRHTDAQWRRCQLRAQPLKTAADWISQYQKFWSEQLDALEDYLTEIQNTKENTNAKRKRTKRSTRKPKSDA